MATPGRDRQDAGQAIDRSEFTRLVRQALARLHDLPALQRHSLARLMPTSSDTRSSRAALQSSLLEAIESLKPDPSVPRHLHAWRGYEILRLRFVEGLEVDTVASQLSLSRSEFFHDQQAAVEAAAAYLWERWGVGQARGAEEIAILPQSQQVIAIPSSNLPLQLTSFVGRENDMAEVRRLLGGNRLLTLTGAGGSGKTRLAVQVAADLLEEYPDGVWLTELASLSDPELVSQAVASSLGLRERQGQPILDTLVSYLKSRQALLVVDNCEHLLESSANLVEALLTTCPKLRVLATSREMLGARGEAAWRVPSLDTPDPRHLPSLEKLTEYESVKLFVERALLVQPAFTVTERNAAALASVCSRLDGIPLAIELAAARSGGLTVEQIAGRLSDRFRLLTGGRRTALRRQQTLRATVDWSHDLLSEPERVLFRRVSVFVGGWSLEAAEGVCADEVVEAADVLDRLLRLVDKSLVVAEEKEGVERYRLPETIRQYAEERLLEAGEAAVVRASHRNWYLALAERVSPGFWRPGEGDWLGQVQLEQDNLRAAMEWSLADDPGSGLHLAVVLSNLWLHQAYYSEGRRWLKESLARATDRTSTRAWALFVAATMAWDQGNYAEARSLAEESLGLCREIGELVSYPLDLLGFLAFEEEGDRESARSMLEQSLAAARQTDDPVAVMWSLGHLGLLTWLRGDYERARALFEEALPLSMDAMPHLTGWGFYSLSLVALSTGDHGRAQEYLDRAMRAFQQVDDKPGIGCTLGYQGYLTGLRGDHGRAVELLGDGLSVLRELGHWPRIPRLLRFQGVVETRQGSYERAVRLIGVAQAARVTTQSAPDPAESAECEAALAAVRSAMGGETFAEAWAEGQAMTLEQAVEYALRDAAER